MSSVDTEATGGLEVVVEASVGSAFCASSSVSSSGVLAVGLGSVSGTEVEAGWLETC